MQDLTSKQLTLPFGLEAEPEYKDIVKQNWQFTFTRQYLGSVYSKRVVALCVAQMKEDGDMRDYYQIRAADIIRETGLERNEVYRRIKLVVHELISVCFIFENEKLDVIIPRHLIDTTRFKNPVGYANGVLTIAFNPTLRDIIMQLAHYSEYDLGTYMRFSSWYSMRLWEILYAFRDKEYAEFEVDNFREWMGCGYALNERTGAVKKDKKGNAKYIKYASTVDMIARTTGEPLKEFKDTELEFTVEPITDSSGRGRPKITKIRFNFVRKPMTTEDEINALISENTAFKRIIERLRTYKVHDEVIAAYASIIGAETLNKTLYSWDIKQQSTDPKLRISNTENYCNKVISEMGRKLASFMKLQENMRKEIEKEGMNL